MHRLALDWGSEVEFRKSARQDWRLLRREGFGVAGGFILGFEAFEAFKALRSFKALEPSKPSKGRMKLFAFSFKVFEASCLLFLKSSKKL